MAVPRSDPPSRLRTIRIDPRGIFSAKNHPQPILQRQGGEHRIKTIRLLFHPHNPFAFRGMGREEMVFLLQWTFPKASLSGRAIITRSSSPHSMHLQQTKRGSIATGGAQYYFHELSDPVLTYLRAQGAVRVALVTPYGATKSDFFAVGKDHKLA